MEAKMSHERHGAQPGMRSAGDFTVPVCGMAVPPTSPHRYRLGVSVVTNALRLRRATA
jgi:hypothetical protein